MATTIKLKRGTGTPASLEHAEPAVDLEKGCLHIGNNGTVQTYQLGCQNYAMPRSKLLLCPGATNRGNPLLATTSVSSSIINFWPVVFPRRVAPNKAFIEVTTAGATGTRARAGVYENGWHTDHGDVPTNKLAETNLFNCETVGLKDSPWTFVFNPGVLYWFAFYTSQDFSMRVISNAAAVLLGRTWTQSTAGCMRRANYYNANADLPNVAPVLLDTIAGNDINFIYLVHFAEMPTYI